MFRILPSSDSLYDIAIWKGQYTTRKGDYNDVCSGDESNRSEVDAYAC